MSRRYEKPQVRFSDAICKAVSNDDVTELKKHWDGRRNDTLYTMAANAGAVKIGKYAATLGQVPLFRHILFSLQTLPRVMKRPKNWSCVICLSNEEKIKIVGEFHRYMKSLPLFSKFWFNGLTVPARVLLNRPDIGSRITGITGFDVTVIPLLRFVPESKNSSDSVNMKSHIVDGKPFNPAEFWSDYPECRKALVNYFGAQCLNVKNSITWKKNWRQLMGLQSWQRILMYARLNLPREPSSIGSHSEHHLTKCSEDNRVTCLDLTRLWHSNDSEVRWYIMTEIPFTREFVAAVKHEYSDIILNGLIHKTDIPALLQINVQARTLMLPSWFRHFDTGFLFKYVKIEAICYMCHELDERPDLVDSLLNTDLTEDSINLFCQYYPKLNICDPRLQRSFNSTGINVGSVGDCGIYWRYIKGSLRNYVRTYHSEWSSFIRYYYNDTFTTRVMRRYLNDDLVKIVDDFLHSK